MTRFWKLYYELQTRISILIIKVWLSSLSHRALSCRLQCGCESSRRSFVISSGRLVPEPSTEDLNLFRPQNFKLVYFRPSCRRLKNDRFEQLLMLITIQSEHMTGVICASVINYAACCRCRDWEFLVGLERGRPIIRYAGSPRPNSSAWLVASFEMIG
jgi:hypothetical protein